MSEERDCDDSAKVFPKVGILADDASAATRRVTNTPLASSGQLNTWPANSPFRQLATALIENLQADQLFDKYVEVPAQETAVFSVSSQRTAQDHRIHERDFEMELDGGLSDDAGTLHPTAQIQYLIAIVKKVHALHTTQRRCSSKQHPITCSGEDKLRFLEIWPMGVTWRLPNNIPTANVMPTLFKHRLQIPPM